MGPKHSTTNNCGDNNVGEYHCGGRSLDAFDGIRMMNDEAMHPDYYSIKYLHIGKDSCHV